MRAARLSPRETSLWWVCQNGTGTWFSSMRLSLGSGTSSQRTDVPRAARAVCYSLPGVGHCSSPSGACSQQALGRTLQVASKSRCKVGQSYSSNRRRAVDPVWEAGSRQRCRAVFPQGGHWSCRLHWSTCSGTGPPAGGGDLGNRRAQKWFSV